MNTRGVPGDQKGMNTRDVHGDLRTRNDVSRGRSAKAWFLTIWLLANSPELQHHTIGSAAMKRSEWID